LALIGIKDAMQEAYDMGIENWEPTADNMRNVGLSLVLGGRETTLHDEVTAYGVFANKGVKKDLVSVLKVTDSRGKKLFEYKDREGRRVFSEEIAFLISHILLDNNARSMAFGPSSYLNIPGRTVAVKTGTTDEKRDNWTIGYTPSFVVGVWVGNNNNEKMNPKIASGVTGASPIWHQLMVRALKGTSNEEFKKPDNVIAMQVDSMAGGQEAYGQPTRSEYFVKGTEPTSKSPVYKDKDGKVYFIFREEDPVSQDGTNRWQQGIDEWINTTHKDEEKYHPPSELTGGEAKPEEHHDDPTATPDPSDTPSPTP
jgi:membrane peptidoglycan carboxypeptidase